MTLSEARKQALARRFGSACSVTEYSPIKAMDDDLAGTFTLYINDMKWLMDATGENVTNCGVTTPTTAKTGINFSTGEVLADIYLNGVKIGSTNQFIETGAGLKTFELRAEGYNTRTVTENVTEGNIMNRSYTMYKTIAETPTEPETPEPTPTPKKTGINISTGEVEANVYSGGIKIGQTNEFIETGAGQKTFELRAEGYNTRTVTENVTEGNILNRSYTLYKTTTTTQDDTTPAQPVLIEGEGGVPLTVEIVMEGGKPVTSQPLEVDVGVAQWYSIMIKNTRDTPWKGYVGVKFTDSTGRTWTKTPEKQYAQTVAPGESKSIKTSVSIPEGSITEGNVAVTMLLRGYR